MSEELFLVQYTWPSYKEGIFYYFLDVIMLWGRDSIFIILHCLGLKGRKYCEKHSAQVTFSPYTKFTVFLSTRLFFYF